MPFFIKKYKTISIAGCHGKTTTTKQTTNKTITRSKDTNKKSLFTVVKDNKKNNNVSEQHKKTAKEINAKT